VHPIPWRQDIKDRFMEKKKLRVGVMRTDGVIDPAPACARALDMTVSALRDQGHDVFDLTLPSAPHSPYEALCIASQLLNADGTKTYRSFFRAGETTDPGAGQMTFYMSMPRPLRYLYYLYVRYIRRDPVWAGLVKGFYAKSAYENWQLVAQREAFKVKWFDWWNGINSGAAAVGDGDMDVILCPPNATPAVPHGGMKDAVSSCGYTFLWNLLDYTCGIVPVTHVDPVKDGLPLGFKLNRLNGVAKGAYKYYDAQKMARLPVAVQVVGRRLEEEKVLAVMERIEKALEEKGQKYELLQML